MSVRYPDTRVCRQGLHDYGVGYDVHSDRLFVSQACKGNEDFTERFNTFCYPPSIVELMVSPYDHSVVIGTVFTSVAEHGWEFRMSLPFLETSPIEWAADIADAYFASLEDNVGEEEALFKNAHVLSRKFASKLGKFPDTVHSSISLAIKRLQKHIH